MVEVSFLGPIQEEPISYDVSNLKELSLILKKDERFSKWLENCAVALNDEIVYDLNLNLKDGDKVTILPPVCGG